MDNDGTMTAQEAAKFLQCMHIALHCVNRHDLLAGALSEGDYGITLCSANCTRHFEGTSRAPVPDEYRPSDFFIDFCTMLWDASASIKFSVNGISMTNAIGTIRVFDKQLDLEDVA